MPNFDLKQKIIGAIVIIGTILILIFQRGFYPKPTAVLEKQDQIQVQSDKPELVSTNPSPLENAILWGTEPIEISFNMPLENAPELKYKIEPKSEMKVELSNDKKTATFTPVKPLPLGTGFTFVVLGEAKFDGNKTLGKDYTFHFRTIVYKGV